MTESSRNEFPLQDLKVLDVSRVVAGPFAGRLLADLGADVVKVEPPEGDATRLYGEKRHGLSGSYFQQNAGKRNICIDLKAPGGRELLLRLAAVADLMIENFRPGVLKRLGLGWDVLREVNPSLVLLSITGFGQTGPEVHRRAYAPVIHAETGLTARQARMDKTPPSDPMPSIADTNASLHGLIAALAALHMRKRTGTGQHIDIAMTDAMLCTDDYSHHPLDGSEVVKVGGDVWGAVHGQVLTAGLFSLVWRQLSSRYPQTFRPDIRADASQREAVAAWVAGFGTRKDLIAGFEAAGVAWADVRDPMDVFAAPWAVARRVCATVPDGGGGERKVVQSPYRFSDASSGVQDRAPYRGEHNAEILHDWLDCADKKIGELAATGVVRQDTPADRT